MAASTSPLDKFRYGASNIATTLQTSISISDTSLTPASVANLPTVTAIDISIDRVDSSGTATPTKWERIIGVVSGGNLVTLLRGQDGSTAQAHSTGAVIEMMPTGKWSQDLMAGILTHANPDGTLLTSAVQTALSLGTGALNGWNPQVNTPNTVVYNGNRSYTCTYNSVDLTSTLSAGMRQRFTRTVAAPTQSTILNGTTQYWSKTSPAGMTFTDNFTASAWVKLTSYSGVQSTIISRYDGTNGWLLDLNTSGTVRFIGISGATNRAATTYQSLPLNKWVHVAATLTMSTGTGNVYIDGLLAPSTISGSGTSLTQAGILQVGAANSASFFPGKIAQAAVFSAVLSQATIQSYISQGLAGTETSLISAYSFNGTANDLNTTNANNLTANGSAVATAADSPFGGQAGGAISSTLDYGIIQSVSFSTNTTVVVQVPEGCTIPTSGGVSAVAYSTSNAYGFPKQRGKWQVFTISRSVDQVVSPTQNVWSNPDSIQLSLPVGEWMLGYEVVQFVARGAAGSMDMASTLATSTSSETDTEFSSVHTSSTANIQSSTIAKREKSVSIPAATPYYLNCRTTNSGVGNIQHRGDLGATVIRAENSYL